MKSYLKVFDHAMVPTPDRRLRFLIKFFFKPRSVVVKSYYKNWKIELIDPNPDALNYLNTVRGTAHWLFHPDLEHSAWSVPIDIWLSKKPETRVIIGENKFYTAQGFFDNYPKSLQSLGEREYFAEYKYYER